MGRLENKVAIITGAASGMGLAAAGLFAKEGATVIATDLAFDELVKQTGELEGNVVAKQLNVTSEEDWARVVEETVQEFDRVDVLVNNAGMFGGHDLLGHTVESFERVLKVNTVGPWLGMRAVIPAMQKQAGGSIVNCSSIAGLVGGVAADNGDPAYSGSKGAVRLMTKSAAQAYAADNIRVNSVHPGPIFTGMAKSIGIETREQAAAMSSSEAVLPLQVGEPIDIAYGYLYLASDESRFVTGSELVIDGGSTSH